MIFGTLPSKEEKVREDGLDDRAQKPRWAAGLQGARVPLTMCELGLQPWTHIGDPTTPGPRD
jgi:hypothetical protein